MPYLITVLVPMPSPHGQATDAQGRTFDYEDLRTRRVSSRAAAKVTCGHVLLDYAPEATLPFARAIDDLPAEGGTIGPLPDGKLIEVARVR